MENENKGKAEKLFRNFGVKIDELMDRVEDSTENWDKEIDERFTELKSSWGKFDEDIKDFTEKNKDKFKDVGIQLEKAAQELKKAVELAFTSKKQ